MRNILPQKRNNIIAYLTMTIPAMLVYSLMILAMLQTFRLGLFQWNGLGDQLFVGFHNYVRLVTDFRFFYSLRNIVILISVTVIFQVGLGILFAFLMVDYTLKGSSLFKTLIFLPVIIPNVAVALFFVEVFEFQYGILNFVRGLLDLEKINVLSGGNTTIWYAVFPQTWQNIGLMFIIAYTGFSSMNTDFIDAAKLEGLSLYQRLVKLYIPVSWDSISTCFIIALVGPLKAFEHIWIITNGGGGDQKTHIPSTLMYKLGFNNYEYGYGSAIGTLICILAVVLVLVFRRLTKAKEGNV